MTDWTLTTWIFVILSVWILWLVVHYNVMKSRKPAPIDFIVDKCVNEGSTPPKKIVLIHGWPDNASLWKYQIPELTKKYDCYRITLPNYDMKAKNYEGINSWGYDLVELAKSVNTCVETQILNRKESQNEKVTLMIHDWGSVVGYLACKFDRKICMNVSFRSMLVITLASMEWSLSLLLLAINGLIAFAFYFRDSLGIY
ncbi:hypothetical protein RFI_04235 [Reticulomyxa filosa]|uniref:AB hydrolase-1 domain-containing protein n=1 Tax=Reticulomyxa filosa TaxID=46433 RepID=X6P5K9_RETFI|nr:hypothetical protein RFI_04235 [Reticulomyxa filosa]|eukprot:ETO32877.1 hypothetical protein RFI_04235 [Reticulomyxa filosa]